MKLDVQYPINIRNGINQAESNSRRKRDHLRTSLTQNVQFDTVGTGLNDYLFVHQALPEIDAGEIDLSVRLFGKAGRAPLLLYSMTRGIQQAQRP
jgi:isopentenyl-diphosphate delta-isomerase